MSQYLVLIRTEPTTGPNGVREYYALTTSNHPPTGLAMLQHYSVTRLTMIHSIHAGNGADNLKRTLEIKYNHCRLHSFWYSLEAQEVTFIQSINERNFRQIQGLIHRQERKPELDTSEVSTLIAESLKKAEGALT